MLVETVYDMEEFIRKIDPQQEVHYKVETKIMGAGDLGLVKLTLYGMSNGKLLKLVKIRTAKCSGEEVKKHNTRNVVDSMKLWIAEESKRLKEKARELKATPGSYEVMAWR